jgi:dCTP deaminase
MSIMSDRWITKMAKEHGMIDPFEGRQVRAGVISYGVSSYGYDMRVAREFRIFTNVLTVTVGKSTYARCGIITNVTPFEPEWEGYVTLEISNTTPLPARIYANEGIAQVLFFKGEEEPEVSYKDKGGKYQKQVGVTLPKL